MKNRSLFVRIIAIALCALMVLSVFAVAFTRVFACEAENEAGIENAVCADFESVY